MVLHSVSEQERKLELSWWTLDCLLAFLPCSERHRLLSGVVELRGLLGKRMVSATWAKAGRQLTGFPLRRQAS